MARSRSVTPTLVLWSTPPPTSAAPALRRASRVRVRRLELEHQHAPIHPCPRTHALNNFVVATSLSLMVASRLVWIWPQRFIHHGHRFASFGRRLRAVWACGVPPTCSEFGCAAALGSLVQSHSMIAAANGDSHLASASARQYVFRLEPFFGLGDDTFQSCIVRACWP